MQENNFSDCLRRGRLPPFDAIFAYRRRTWHSIGLMLGMVPVGWALGQISSAAYNLLMEMIIWADFSFTLDCLCEILITLSANFWNFTSFFNWIRIGRSFRCLLFWEKTSWSSHKCHTKLKFWFEQKLCLYLFTAFHVTLKVYCWN